MTNRSFRVIRVPLAQQRFTTLGDWWEDPSGEFTISIAEMNDWRYEFLVLIHELTEWGICQAKGILTSDCDAFDEMWEKKIEVGEVPPEIEAGFAPECPYRKGHVWGARMERLFAWLLGVRWKSYCSACDEAIVGVNEALRSVS